MNEIAKAMVLPSNIAAALMLVGSALALKDSIRHKALGLVALGSIIYLVCSNGAVATALIAPLENY